MNQLDVYSILVKQNEQMLYAYVMGIVKDPVLSEDVVQESFVLAYEKLETLKDKNAFGAWLRAIAKNVAIQELRKQKREIQVEPSTLLGLETFFSKVESITEDTWADKVKFIKECFESLPDVLYRSSHMHYYQNRKTKEIAEILNVALATILKRLERSRLELRGCVEGKLKAENG